jgi:RNA polymerase sigma factor (sigma-70 family)
MPSGRVEDLLRELAPQVLATLTRQHGQFEACEDATQDALIAGATQWPENGLPSHPRAWLLTVARRALVDHWRSESARRRREDRAGREWANRLVMPGPDTRTPGEDDTLTLMLLCCHPAIQQPSQVALTMRALGGLTTNEIAAAFLVPEATMAKRITRAKRAVAEAGARFEMPTAEDLHARVQAVLEVLYLVFNEGYTATSGPTLHRVDLSAEAIRLTRQMHRLIPADGEVAGCSPSCC